MISASVCSPPALSECPTIGFFGDFSYWNCVFALHLLVDKDKLTQNFYLGNYFVDAFNQAYFKLLHLCSHWLQNSILKCFGILVLKSKTFKDIRFFISLTVLEQLIIIVTK